MIAEIAFEGIDGSGKTSTLHALNQTLTSEGLRVETFAPYRLANELLGQDIYELWQHEDTAGFAVQTLTKIIHNCQEEAAEHQADVILYDRHWLTAFTEIGDKPELTELWGDTFCDVAFMKVKPTVARARCTNDLDEPWMSEAALSHADSRFSTEICKRGKYLLGLYRSDADVTPETLANNIRWDMQIRR